MATIEAAAALGPPARRRRRSSPEAVWGWIMLVPYAVVFALFVIFPILYGLWLGSEGRSYARLMGDPIYLRTVRNTLLFLLFAVNLKLILALLLSGFFYNTDRWIRWLGVIFLLPWAVPSVASILSFRWMFNSDWGYINSALFKWFGIEGPGWLISPESAFGLIVTVHIWKYLPFWTLILLAGRMAIPRELYEAAAVDGATGPQQFRYVTWPSLKNLYITCTLLSTIWTLGDFNSVYLLTGGGPSDSTHVLATLGIRYAFSIGDVRTGVATAITAIPIIVPLVIVLIHRLGRGRPQ